MGSYSQVRVCVRGDGPLSAEVRARIVELCRKHELLSGPCVVAIHETKLGPAPSLWERAKRALVSAPPVEDRFVQIGLQPYAGTGNLVVVGEGECGRWVDECVRERGTEFVVNTPVAKWKGESREGAFGYLATNEPFSVPEGEERSRRRPRGSPIAFDARDRFWDVLTLFTRAHVDGREMASSRWVREMKAELALEVTCRANLK